MTQIFSSLNSRQIAFLIVAAVIICAQLYLVIWWQETEEPAGKTKCKDCLPELKQRNVSSIHLAKCNTKSLLKQMKSPDDLPQFRTCNRVFYNRVPKCGSRAVLATFANVSHTNNFYYVSIPKSKGYFLQSDEEIANFTLAFSKLQEPVLFAKHIHYIDFEKYNEVAPLYINVIRDPIERAASHYYFNLHGSSNGPKHRDSKIKVQTFDECVASSGDFCTYATDVVLPFFCGHSKLCRHHHRDVLARAKQTVRDMYLVVGVTSELESFMEIIEYFLPHYFHNATAIFRQNEQYLLQKYKTIGRQNVQPETKRILLHKMAVEYEFYVFIKQRLYNQVSKVRLLKQHAEISDILMKDDLDYDLSGEII